ncbi:hypothetical protein AB0K51_34755 [Kitasatospora sp. NPDC049285]|uniref:hypothetical protein n=1 Tax=Kitasatospora sp. NPDC049285 TaxID=3157096 RepID=UPI003445F53D
MPESAAWTYAQVLHELPERQDAFVIAMHVDRSGAPKGAIEFVSCGPSADIRDQVRFAMKMLWEYQAAYPRGDRPRGDYGLGATCGGPCPRLVVAATWSSPSTSCRDVRPSRGGRRRGLSLAAFTDSDDGTHTAMVAADPELCMLPAEAPVFLAISAVAHSDLTLARTIAAMTDRVVYPPTTLIGVQTEHGGWSFNLKASATVSDGKPGPRGQILWIDPPSKGGVWSCSPNARPRWGANGRGMGGGCAGGRAAPGTGADPASPRRAGAAGDHRDRARERAVHGGEDRLGAGGAGAALLVDEVEGLLSGAGITLDVRAISRAGSAGRAEPPAGRFPVLHPTERQRLVTVEVQFPEEPVPQPQVREIPSGAWVTDRALLPSAQVRFREALDALSPRGDGFVVAMHDATALTSLDGAVTFDTAAVISDRTMDDGPPANSAGTVPPSDWRSLLKDHRTKPYETRPGLAPSRS